MINRHELDNFKDTFFEMNYSMTGNLTREELINNFWKHGYTSITYYEIDTILACVDEDNSGQINFSEFLVTAIEPLRLLTREKVTKAFRTFDTDNGGSISVDELQDVLCPGSKIQEDDLRYLLELEEDEDISKVQISINEFKSFLTNIFLHKCI